MGSGLENGAGRIARQPRPTAAYLVVLGLLAFAPGCAADRDNAFVRARRQRHLEGARAEQLRAENERWQLQRTMLEDRAAMEQNRDDAVAIASQRRDRGRELAHELAVLKATEQDLAAAKTRQQAVAAELAPLRAAEQQLADQQQRIAALQQQTAALAPAVAAAEAELAKVAAELQPKLDDLRQKVARSKELQAAVEAALTAVTGLGTSLAPPPAEKPAGDKPAGDQNAPKK
jgi:DNA repair exonuclease SbcCD ATPase subunit